METYKIEANPYGYKQKDIAASGKEFLIGISGSEDLFVRSQTVAFKNKEVDVKIWSENLRKIDLSMLQQLEDTSLFSKKPPGPKSQALAFFVGNFDENEFGGVFDSNFLYSIKVGNAERYMLVRILKDEKKPTTKHVPDDIFAAASKWIGSVLNATAYNEASDTKRAIIDHVCAAITKEYSNQDQKKFRQDHKYLSDARWGSLKKFQSRSMDPFKTMDPLGNTIAHLAMHNPNFDVFMHIAQTYPALLNAQNIFGNTPFHHLALLHLRHPTTKYFDWKWFWELPWDYSTKNKMGLTGLEQLCKIWSKDLIVAINALTDNAKAWTEAKKYHDASTFLTSVIVIHLSEDAKIVSHEEVLKAVKPLLVQGTTDKDTIFNAALQYRQPILANYLLDNGATVSVKSILTAFQTLNRSIVDIALKKFDLSTLSKNQLNSLCQDTAAAGWADIVGLLAKKGCEFELAWNDKPSMTLPVATLIARLHCPVILPLKYLSVDVLSNSVPKEELDKILANFPEEMKALFHERDSWRWTLFVKNEDRRSRFLQLYQAIRRAQRSSDNKAMQINIGNIEFSVDTIRRQVHNFKGWKEKIVGLKIWPGELKETPYEAYEISIGDKSGQTRTNSAEQNQEVLDTILEKLGWPIEDTYIFLIICYYAFPAIGKEDYTGRISQLKAKKFFCQKIIDEHIDPPKWYEKFLQHIYGINVPQNRIRTRNPGYVSFESDDSVGLFYS